MQSLQFINPEIYIVFIAFPKTRALFQIYQRGPGRVKRLRICLCGEVRIGLYSGHLELLNLGPFQLCELHVNTGYFDICFSAAKRSQHRNSMECLLNVAGVMDIVSCIYPFVCIDCSWQKFCHL